MSQQINLLNPALIKKKQLLTPKSILIAVTLFSIAMLSYYSYIKIELSSLIQQRNQLAETLSKTQAQLQQTAMMHAPREVNVALLAQITKLQEKEKIQQQILDAVKLSTSNPESGYAALMLAFSRQSIDGLWLTSFNMNSDSNQLDINGRATQSELVPEYISRLGNEPVLKGKTFSTLSMRLPKTDAAKPDATSELKLPTDAISSSNHNVSNALPQPGYIEFSLQASTGDNI